VQDFRGVDVPESHEAVLPQQPGLELLGAAVQQPRQNGGRELGRQWIPTVGRGLCGRGEPAECTEPAGIHKQQLSAVQPEPCPQMVDPAVGSLGEQQASRHSQVNREPQRSPAARCRQLDQHALSRTSHADDLSPRNQWCFPLAQQRIEDLAAPNDPAGQGSGKLAGDGFDFR